ncbi:MAG: hypothetical protein ACLFOY_12995 [Desulfatibacillaceae bacterium]
MQDLWPSEIKESGVNSPVAILREQSRKLAEKTGNRISADVRHVGKAELEDVPEEMSPGSFRYEFILSSPQLKGFHFTLFRILHDASLYPVFIYPHDEAKAEVWPNVPGAVLADGEKDFLEVVQKIFRSEATTKILSAVLAQVEK